MKSLALLVGVCLAVVARAQQFQNLDFELGSTPPNYDVFNTNPTERQQILPGWISYYRNPAGIEDNLDNAHAYPLLSRGDSVCIGSPCVTIGPSFSMHGKWGLRIDSGYGLAETGVRQSGQLPTTARTLTFRAKWWSTLLVRIDDISVEPVVLSGTTTEVTYGIDISRFSGQTRRLTIATEHLADFSVAEVDDIRFLDTAINPLPPVMAFSGIDDHGRSILAYTGVLQAAYSVVGPYTDVEAAVGGRFLLPAQFGFRPYYRVRN